MNKSWEPLIRSLSMFSKDFMRARDQPPNQDRNWPKGAWGSPRRWPCRSPRR